MKILAIGDFHGKFPVKLQREARNADIILCTGDFPSSDKIRKIIFKHWTDKKWWEDIGVKKAKKLMKESFDSGLKVMGDLNKIGKKVYFVWGNSDFYKELSTSEPEEIKVGDYDSKIKKFKNLILINRKKRKLKGFELIGHGGYVDVDEFIKNPIDKTKKKQKKRVQRYKKDKSKLEKLFKKKPSGEFIFLVHYTPYGIFDKVKFKGSPMYGRHVGWSPYNKVIERHKPSLVICGHMHEYQGMKNLGKTKIITTGPAFKGKAAIIEIEKDKIKKIKFLR